MDLAYLLNVARGRLGQYISCWRRQQNPLEDEPLGDAYARETSEPALAQAAQEARPESTGETAEHAEASSSSMDPGVGPLTPAAFTYVHDTVKSMATANPPRYAHWMYTYSSCYDAVSNKSSCTGGRQPLPKSDDMNKLVAQVQQAFVQAMQSAEQQHGYAAFMQACAISLKPMQYALRQHEAFDSCTLRDAAEAMFVGQRQKLCRDILSSTLPDGVTETIAAAIQVAAKPEQ